MELIFSVRVRMRLSRYDDLETKQKSLFDVFVWVNLSTVTVTELIVFSYNEVTVQ
jgi:hypothetical protein